MRSRNNDVTVIDPRRYSVSWLIIALATILVLTFFPYLFDGKTFFPSDMFDTMTAPFNAEYAPVQAQNLYLFDAYAQNYTYKVQTQQALKRAQLAYWNPHIMGGFPQYAETGANNFDVFNILYLWLNPNDGFLLQTILELLLAGIGMILLLRFFGVSPSANLIFSAAYMLNSLFVANAEHRSTVASFCWVPFVTLMILRYFRSGRKDNLIWTSVFLALAFMGWHFQTSFYAAFIVAVIVLSYPSSDSVRTRLGILGTIGVASFALSAVMWLPTVELLIQAIFHGGRMYSSSVYTAYTIEQRFLSIPLLSNFFFPSLFGDPQVIDLKRYAGADKIDFNGAIGFLPSLFALIGSRAFWHEKTIRPFIVLGISAFVLPIGTPLFMLLYHRFFIVASFSFCVVGAVAFESFMVSEWRRNMFEPWFRWVRILFVGLAGGLLIISVSCTIFAGQLVNYLSLKTQDLTFSTGKSQWMLGKAERTVHYYSLTSPALWLPILGAGITLVALSWYRRGKCSRTIMYWVASATTMLQVFLFARSWFPSVDLRDFPIYPPNPAISYLQHAATNGRYIVWRDLSKDPYILQANCSSVYGIDDINGYESCRNRSMSVFYHRHVPLDSIDLRLLGLANVRYVVTGARALTSPSLRRLYAADGITISENLLCKPRAYFVSGSHIVHSDSDATIELLRPEFDGSNALFTQEDAPSGIPSYRSGMREIKFEKSESEEVLLRTKTAERQVLVLTDTYYPGWKCYVNGKPTAIYLVNHCMRAVIVEAGTSTVDFRFEPEIFAWGAGISGLAIASSLIGFLVLRSKERRRAHKPSLGPLL